MVKRRRPERPLELRRCLFDARRESAMTNRALWTSAAVVGLLALCAAGPTWAKHKKHRHPPSDASSSGQVGDPDLRRKPAYNGSLNGPISVYTSPSAATMGELPQPPGGRAPTSPASPGSPDPTPPHL
jgi:hypothetical protein